MNRKTLTALFLASAAAVAGQAFAETPDAIAQARFVSGKSRAEAQAELAQFKAAGVNPWSTTYNPLRALKTSTSRADVSAAYVAARDEVAAFDGEDSGSAYLAQATQGKWKNGAKLAGQPANTAR